MSARSSKPGLKIKYRQRTFSLPGLCSVNANESYHMSLLKQGSAKSGGTDVHAFDVQLFYGKLLAKKK